MYASPRITFTQRAQAAKKQMRLLLVKQNTLDYLRMNN